MRSWWRKWTRRLGNGPPSGRAASRAAESAPEGWTPKVRAGVHSVIGHVREHNEDSYYVPGFPPVVRYASVTGSGSYDPTVEMSPAQGPGFVFVVADGMGGQQAGEQASQMAVEIIPHWLSTRLRPDDGRDRAEVRELVRDAMAKANEDILALAGLGPEYQNMGTTCVVTLFHNRRAYIAGIGDSRVYRLRDGAFEQLTKDHSLAKALEEAGTIRPEEVATHKFSHVLYLYLGSRDAKDGPETVRDLELAPGDRFLLASDGLTGVVADAQLAELIAQTNEPQQTALALVNLALDRHSKDNITCAVIHVE